jgi:uncharacterized repeat protein (TIGR03803 family)
MRPDYVRSVLTTVSLVAIVGLVSSARAAQFKVLHAFAGARDGSGPNGGLASDPLGTLYGTAAAGGAKGKGTLFRVTPSGMFSVLHIFGNGDDGAQPYSGLYRTRRGNFFGTTNAGGVNNAGTVFEFKADGSEVVLHSFGGAGDGAHPYAPLVHDNVENLYGTTTSGGANNLGTVFRLASDGTETVLYSFKAGSDGTTPYGGLVRDSGGNLFGTTAEAGGNYCGTAFKIEPDGTFVVVYTFQGYPTDGCQTYGGLELDKSGNFFGTTFGGGVEKVNGTVFELAQNGSENVLYSFKGRADCGFPRAAVIGSKTGNVVYGTTSGGGYTCSTVFRIKDGKATVLHAFNSETDGAVPMAPLVEDDTGNLYGTASQGGASNYGTVFEVTDR